MEFQVSQCPVRLWAMSDIHADKKENMQWLSELDLEAFFGFAFFASWIVCDVFLEVIGCDF